MGWIFQAHFAFYELMASKIRELIQWTLSGSKGYSQTTPTVSLFFVDKEGRQTTLRVPMAKLATAGRQDVDRLLKLKTCDDTKFSPSKSSPSKPKRKRKILKPLQRSAQDENTLVGNDRPEAKRKGKRKLLESTLDSPRKIQRTIFSYMSPVKIYHDPDNTENEDKRVINGEVKSEEIVEKSLTKLDSEEKLKSSDSEIDSEAERLMVQKDVPEEYWKEIAEQRREALSEALEENEKLHSDNENLKEKVEILKEENEALKEENEGLKGMAEKAEYFAGMVNLLMKDEEEKESSESEKSEENSDDS